MQVLSNLTDAVLAVDGRHGFLPAVPSRAMGEREVEGARFKGKSDWDLPVTDTHSFGGITLTAACDDARCFADLFGGQRTPVYGHLVLARSALETSVVSAWLNEVGVGAEERIKRGLDEQLFSSYELKRAALEGDKPEDRIKYWKDVAKSFGWSGNKDKDGKVRVDGVGRPSVPVWINRLLVDGREASIGRTVWSYLSAVNHGTWWGLRDAIVQPPSGRGASGLALAGIGTQSKSVLAQAACLLVALRRAAIERFDLMGWADDEWRAVSAVTERHVVNIIKAGSSAPGSH